MATTKGLEYDLWTLDFGIGLIEHDQQYGEGNLVDGLRFDEENS